MHAHLYDFFPISCCCLSSFERANLCHQPLCPEPFSLLQDFKLPENVRATTSAAEAIPGAQFAVHAVPVQSSRAFLKSIKDLLPASVPIISVSKGLEVGTTRGVGDEVSI